MLAPASTLAAIDLSERVRVSGFATLGAIKGGNEYLGLPQDLQSQPVFDGDWDLSPATLIGVQLDGHINDQWQATVQFIGKERLDDSLANSLAWAYITYRPAPEWTLRAGRIAFDLYMMSEYRDVGFSYLHARPSMEYYTQVNFNGFDGVDLAWGRNTETGQLRAKVFAGRTSTEMLRNDHEFEMDLDLILGLTLDWESERWHWRISALSTDVSDDYDYFPGLDTLGQLYQQIAPYWQDAARYEQIITLDKTSIDYLSFGVSYQNAPWQVQAEAARIEPDLALYPVINSGYISLGRQFGAVTGYVMASIADGEDIREEVALSPVDPTNPLSFQIRGMQEATQRMFDTIGINQQSASLGLRWDIRYDLALKVQWDRSWVKRYGAALWQVRETPDNDQVLDTFSINLNGIF